MEFANLVSFTKVYGRRGSDTIILIPFYSEYDYLAKHLDALEKQTSHDFDIILMLNPFSDEKKVFAFIESKNPPFCVVVAKRKEDTGSAGGFFTCQKYALENSYKYMILSDIDCLPIDQNLIINLLNNKDNDYVKPSVQLMDNNHIVHMEKEAIIPWYNLLSTDLVNKYGLYYLPIYYGADDVEYSERIKRKPFLISNYCQHNFTNKAYNNFDKYLLYLAQLLIVTRRPLCFIYNLFNLWISLSTFLIFLPSYGKAGHNALLHSLLSHTYGKSSALSIKSNFQHFIFLQEKPVGFLSLNYDSSWVMDKTYSLMPLKVFTKTFRRNMVIEKSNSGFLVTITAVFAKKAFYKIDKNKYLLLTDNSNAILHAIRLLLLPLYMFWLIFFILFVIVPIKIILQPNTLHYGLG